jgi:hypothetical protein
MKKVVRLTESDLNRIIRRIINEDSFTFGDKVRSKLGDLLFDIEPNSPQEERLGLEIYDKVKRGNYKLIKSMKGYRGEGYVISVNLDGEECIVNVGKERVTMTEKYTYNMRVDPPGDDIIMISGSGLIKKIMNLLKR